MTLYVVVGILAAMAVALGLQGLGRVLAPGDEVAERIESLVRVRGKAGRSEGLRTGDDASPFWGRMDKTIAKQDFAERIRIDLGRANLSLTVSEYLSVRAAVIVVAFIAGYLLQSSLLTGLLLGAVGYGLPIVYIRSRQAGRLRAFNHQLPDVLDHLVGSLRAGYGMLQAVEWVSKQMPHPAGAEFDRVIREVQLGRSLGEALDSIVQRIDSDDLALIVTAIKIQYEVGGNLADILETVAHTIRERVRIQRDIAVLTAQQRYSGYVLMLLPIALAFVIFLMHPTYMMQLFTPGPTLCIPIGTGVMMIIGFFVMRRIVDIEV
jgi:tight adherence protein B